MAARRKRRARRRRGRFGFLYKLFSLFLILAAIVTGCIVFFRANHIVVSGESRYSEEEIIAATGIEEGQNLFQLDKFSIIRQMRSQLPYLDDISITRKLPDTLVITVTDSQPVAALEYNGEWWLLDSGCSLLERGDASLAQGRAVLLGLTPLSPSVGTRLAVDAAEEDKLTALLALLAAMEERGMTSHITDFIDLTSEGEIRLGYDGTLTVAIPLYSGDFALQALRLEGALAELQEQNGTVAGTLTLPSEGTRAWLTAQRWMPEGLPESTGTAQSGTEGESGTEDASGAQTTPTPEPSPQVTPTQPQQAQG